VSKVRKNDVIWHYVDGQIVAVSMALENAQESPKPAELKLMPGQLKDILSKSNMLI